MRRAIIILYVLVFGLICWVAYICYCDLHFDSNSSAGIIVSALGAMVITLLVAWQILQNIDAKDRLKAMEEQITHTSNAARIEAQKTMFVSLCLLGNSFFNRVEWENHNTSRHEDWVNENKQDIMSAISILINAASMWDEDQFTDELCVISHTHMLNRLRRLCEVVHSVMVESEEDLRVYREAAMKLNNSVITEFVLRIIVEPTDIATN